MISIIAAVADNRAIGRNGDLAFHISADLKRFKQLTVGHPVIMGRKTFESLPKGALPDRHNIVISRNPSWTAPGVKTATSLDEALRIAAECSNGETFIIGGGQIYREAMPLADTLYLTRIFAPSPEADTFFPPYETISELIEANPIETDPESGIKYQFQTYRRIR